MAARLLADCSRQYCCDGARTSRIFAQEQRRRQTDETRAWRVGGQPYDAVLLPFRGQKNESPGENVRVHATNTISTTVAARHSHPQRRASVEHDQERLRQRMCLRKLAASLTRG